MSSEMRDLIERVVEAAVALERVESSWCGDPNELEVPRRELEDAKSALLARTEAGADGADMIQWRYTNAETGEVLTPWTECDAAFREKRKDAPGYQFRELFARPQDASGDAEDAARWRHVRKDGLIWRVNMLALAKDDIDILFGAKADAAVDDAMQAKEAK